jgi:hypothetical protein
LTMILTFLLSSKKVLISLKNISFGTIIDSFTSYRFVCIVECSYPSCGRA